VMSATAIVRFWTLVMLAYVFLEEEGPAYKSNGTAMSALDRRSEKSSTAIVVMCSIGFMGNSNPALSLTPCMNFSRLEPTRPQSA
jgi:hypothetical protein